MLAKIITNLIFIIGLAALQAGFISGLPGAASGLNLALVVLIFILGFGSFGFALAWAAGLGWLLETFSFLPFGVLLSGLCLTIIISNLLLNYFFTNRSLYSFLALTGLATVVYKLIISLLVLIFSVENLFLPAGEFWLAMFSQLGLNMLASLFIFYFLHFLGKNFKPVFLMKNKKY